MSDILCRWLNEELRLSKAVDPKTFAKNFSSGYLIGEVLHKYQLQNDFSMFMKKDTSISKLNNFTRLEPTLQLLGISFDINTAQDLMQEKQGAATRLLYQLYVSLEKKKKAEISGTVMEIMQPAAMAGLHKKEHEIYSDRLHQVVKRDAELKLRNISEYYEEKCQQLSERSMMTQPIQQTRPVKGQDVKRMMNIEKLRVCQQKHNSITAYRQAAIVQMPRPPPHTSQLNLKRRQHQQQRREQQAQRVQTEIAQFETNRKRVATYSFSSPSSGQHFSGDPFGGSSIDCEVPGKGTKLILQSNSKYIQDIRQRLEDSALAREQREKRRDRFLLEQLKAHEAQEEARREDQLVRRLTRQTQQEQRLAAQLLQMRKQKEVIQENRLFREQQYQQRREREFHEALEREAALAQQAKLECAEEIRKELEHCSRIAAERTQRKYKKHFTICKDIVEQMVDLTTKIGEYRLLTEKLIPQKLMREWKELLFSGLPLYEPMKGQQPGFEFPPLDPVELKKQEILKNQDYDEYNNMVGEWEWPEEAGETKLTPTNNNILGHVVQRLRNILNPPVMESSLVSFPQFSLKACVLGKFCSGKTTCLSKFAQAHGIHVLAADRLIEEAIIAYRNEKVMEQQGECKSEQLCSTSPDLKSQEKCNDGDIKMSTQAMLGAAVEQEQKRGSVIPDELLVNIIAEAIRKVPAHSGWILDGFPADITQAHLLEEALGGSVDQGHDDLHSRYNLAADPNPPTTHSTLAPVLHLALLLDVPDECVVRRASGQDCTDTEAPTTTSSCSTDSMSYQAQTPHRISAFEDAWPKLEKWFGGRQNILVRVDADVEEEELYKRVESALQQVQFQRQACVTSRAEDELLRSGKALESLSSATPSPVDRSPANTEKDPGLFDSCSSLKGEEIHRVKSLSRSNPSSPRGHSRKSSTSSLTNTGSQRITKIPSESATPLPGSPSWVYVDEPLPPEIPEYLCTHWEAVCNTYVDNIKMVMQQLRSHRTTIDHHLYNIREEFKLFLKRPDLKQELVTQWQKDFNGITDEIREDEHTKAELHPRLDELRERLWDISDKRKEGDDKEKAALEKSWFEDQSAVLINNHSVLMQVELNRFQGTLHFLKVYYLGMYKQVLPELPSNLVCIPLLDKDLDESTEPEDTSVCSQTDDGEPKLESKLCGDSSREISQMKNQDQTEPAKSPPEKLISDYEEALAAISKLVSAEAHQGETKEHKEKPPEPKAPASAKKKENKKSSKKTKGPPTPPPAPSPAPAEVKNTKKSHAEKVRDKIHHEYAAALAHEENAAKVRIALVKGHGLVVLRSLNSRAEQTFSSMEKWLQEHFVSDMKSIDQLTEVVHSQIETGTQLKKELVLECTNFYLNGDHNMVASPAPPPRPTSLEPPTQSTLTITPLEAFHRQLYSVAPSGLIPSSELSSMLVDFISGNMDMDSLPQLCLEKSEKQVLSLPTDDGKLIDWRQFLLSAALPWPFPSLTQLLEVLQHFRTADAGNTGFINEEQYQQIELWFPKESALTIPEDPSEPLPYDHLANIHKFFFQLFADHSLSPPQLDYVSMLQYFAADLDPKEGFIRALSVVSGHHLQHTSSMGQLVTSMPSIEAAELSSPDLNDENMKADTHQSATNSMLEEQGVFISALLSVACNKLTKMEDGYPIPPSCLSLEEYSEQCVNTARELGYREEGCVPFSILSEHHFIQELIENTTQHQLVNFHMAPLAQPDEVEATSLTLS